MSLTHLVPEDELTPAAELVPALCGIWVSPDDATYRIALVECTACMGML